MNVAEGRESDLPKNYESGSGNTYVCVRRLPDEGCVKMLKS
jgi:hypothetical protein